MITQDPGAVRALQANRFHGYDVPKTHRVSRCVECDRAYCWKGSAARPGCPVCGGGLTTTTRMLKRVDFIELAGELLTIAELKPTGLAGYAKGEDRRAAELEHRADRIDEHVAAGELVQHPRLEDYWTTTTDPAAPYFENLTRKGSEVWLRERAAKHRAKAETHRRRAAKLAG